MKHIFPIALAALALPATSATVTIDPATVRNIGGVDTFDRAQFITLHASPTDPDTSDAQYDYLVNELDVSYGRDGGVQSWRMGVTPADPENGEMPDVAWMKKEGEKVRAEHADTPRHVPAFMRETVLCTHPEFMVGIPGNDHAAFGPRSEEAAAEWTANYLKHYWSDEDRPKYYEIFNEPFVHAKDIGTTRRQMAEQHVVQAKRIRELVPDILIGGYSAAWAEVEAADFKQWEDNQQMFMDVAGEHMDFFSTHLYDGINVQGTHAERTGSNTEAILDLIDHYSFIKFGVAKPQTITEYGRIIFGDEGKTWPARGKRIGLILRSMIGMNHTFMDHPDRVIKAIPFILGVGEWTYDYAGGTEEEPYSFVLFRRSGGKGHYVTTELELFYKFWKGIEGQWRQHASDDPDVRVHALADGRRLNLVLTNLDDTAHEVTLKGLDGLDISKVALRTLTTAGDFAELRERTLPAVPETVSLDVGASAVVMVDTRAAIPAERTVTETRTYATDYLQAIAADEPVGFTFENTPTGDEGHATLRLSIGRTPGLSLAPEVTFNGQAIDFPTDWMGGTQEGRPTFYGMIEVPVPLELVKDTNQIKLTFPDDGGKVAAAVLVTSVVE